MGKRDEEESYGGKAEVKGRSHPKKRRPKERETSRKLESEEQPRGRRAAKGRGHWRDWVEEGDDGEDDEDPSSSEAGPDPEEPS